MSSTLNRLASCSRSFEPASTRPCRAGPASSGLTMREKGVGAPSVGLLSGAIARAGDLRKADIALKQHVQRHFLNVLDGAAHIGGDGIGRDLAVGALARLEALPDLAREAFGVITLQCCRIRK